MYSVAFSSRVSRGIRVVNAGRLTTWYLYMRSDSEALRWPFPSQFTPSSDRLFFSCRDLITSTTPGLLFRGALLNSFAERLCMLPFVPRAM